jgi:excisionase family DNA binding protein
MTTLVNNSTREVLPALVKVSDVARYLSVSRMTVHHLLQNGDLVGSTVSPSTKERRHCRITRDSLEKFYRKRFGHTLSRALANPYQP